MPITPKIAAYFKIDVHKGQLALEVAHFPKKFTPFFIRIQVLQKILRLSKPNFHHKLNLQSLSLFGQTFKYILVQWSQITDLLFKNKF